MPQCATLLSPPDQPARCTDRSMPLALAGTSHWLLLQSFMAKYQKTVPDAC